MDKIKVGIVGLGWWGPKLLKNFLSNEKVETIIGCDLDEARRNFITHEFQVQTIASPLDLVGDTSVNAIVIATPPSTHYEIAKLALTKGKHVLLTKPPTSRIRELEDLVRISRKKNLTFMLDSAFIFAPATQKVKIMLEEGSFPFPKSVYSFRHGNDLHFHDIDRLRNTMFKNSIDVIEDLLFHDLALITYLFDKELQLSSIRRFFNLSPRLCDTAIVDLDSNDFPVHISLSWTLPERKRQFILFAKDKCLVLDDLKENNKLNVFEFETKAESDIPYEKEGPLLCEVSHFVSCIINGSRPLTDGTFMLRVMDIYDQIRTAGK